MALYDIGKAPELPEYTQTDADLNESLLTKMKVADILPVYFNINVDTIGDIISVPGLTHRPVRLNYNRARLEFHRKLISVSFPAPLPPGVRVWMVHDSTANESLSHDYKPNVMSELFNTHLSKISQITQVFHSKGLYADPSYANAGGLTAALLDGRQASLPSIWEKSTYSPSLEIVTKLSTPHGDHESFEEHIAKPLICLLALVSPSSYDGFTYGLPPFFTVKVYGVSMMYLAYLESISINRCGGDIRFNSSKQPLDIVINMSFKPAMPGFAAVLNGGDIADMSMIRTTHADATTSPDVSGGLPGLTTLGSIINSLRPAPPDASDISFGGFDFGTFIFGSIVGLIGWWIGLF